MAKITVDFDARRLKRNVNDLRGRINRNMAATMQYNSGYAVGWLKQNAPWHDNTGAARTGLTALATSFNEKHEILMAYSVYYGIWLEVAHSGRWAVITPGMRIIGEKVMRDMEYLIRAMLNGV